MQCLQVMDRTNELKMIITSEVTNLGALTVAVTEQTVCRHCNLEEHTIMYPHTMTMI